MLQLFLFFHVEDLDNSPIACFVFSSKSDDVLGRVHQRGVSTIRLPARLEVVVEFHNHKLLLPSLSSVFDCDVLI